MFSIGLLTNPKADDKNYPSKDEAIQALLTQTLNNIDNNIYAVWDNDSGEILAIIYLGIVYYP